MFNVYIKILKTIPHLLTTLYSDTRNVPVSVILDVSAARKLRGNTLSAKVANIKCAK